MGILNDNDSRNLTTDQRINELEKELQKVIGPDFTITDELRLEARKIMEVRNVSTSHANKQALEQTERAILSRYPSTLHNRNHVEPIFQYMGETTAYTDGSLTVLNYGNELIITAPTAEDAFSRALGMFGHETAHKLYTDCKGRGDFLEGVANGVLPSQTLNLPITQTQHFQDNLKQLQEDISTNPMFANYMAQLFATAENIIEDGYIEERFVHEFKGRVAFSLKSFQSVFYTHLPNLEELDKRFNEDPISAPMTGVFALLSYAKYGNFKTEDDNYDLNTSPAYNFCKEALPFIDITMDTHNALARRELVVDAIASFYDKIRDSIVNNPQPEQGGQSGSSSSSSNGGGSSSGSSGGSSGGSSSGSSSGGGSSSGTSSSDQMDGPGSSGSERQQGQNGPDKDSSNGGGGAGQDGDKKDGKDGSGSGASGDKKADDKKDGQGSGAGQDKKQPDITQDALEKIKRLVDELNKEVEKNRQSTKDPQNTGKPAGDKAVNNNNNNSSNSNNSNGGRDDGRGSKGSGANSNSPSDEMTRGAGRTQGQQRNLTDVHQERKFVDSPTLKELEEEMKTQELEQDSNLKSQTLADELGLEISTITYSPDMSVEFNRSYKNAFTVGHQMADDIANEIASLNAPETLYYQERGRIHIGSVIRAKANSTNNAYQLTKEPTAMEPCRIAMLIDCSGSMGSYGMDFAKNVTAQIGGFADSLEIPFAVNGFTSDEIITAVSYDKVRGDKELHKITALRSTGGTELARQIEFTKRKLLEDTSLGPVIIVVTDGETFDKAETIQKVKECDDEGIQLFGIAMNNEGFRSLKSCGFSPENIVLISNPSAVSMELTEKLKDSISTLIREWKG